MMNDVELKAFIRGIKFIGEYLIEHGHIGEHVKSKVDQCASHFSKHGVKRCVACDYCGCTTDVESCIDPLGGDESNICSECHSELKAIREGWVKSLSNKRRMAGQI